MGYNLKKAQPSSEAARVMLKNDLSVEQRIPHPALHFVAVEWRVFALALERGRLHLPGRFRVVHADVRISVPATGVPAGADIVAAFLYWETVESSQTTFAGQQGYFNGYPIAGAVLGNPNSPVSWSSGGCTGSSQGSKTMRTYRADVRPYLKLDAQGHVQGVVKLADSGSNGGGAPLTLGASLVVIYRVLSPALPLNSVVLYDGAYAPGNTTTDLSLDMHGFYEAAAGPVAKLTHIVGNGQSNKSESVYLLNDKTNITVPLPSLYGKQKPAFPGFYNGSWDNPTWVVNSYGAAVNAEDSSETTSVTASGNCVSWGAIVFSSTVQDTDNDGLLDVWEGPAQGYTDVKDGSFVALPGASPTQKDIFIQVDSMCSVVKADGTCDTSITSFAGCSAWRAELRSRCRRSRRRGSSGRRPRWSNTGSGVRRCGWSPMSARACPTFVANRCCSSTRS